MFQLPLQNIALARPMSKISHYTNLSAIIINFLLVKVNEWII